MKKNDILRALLLMFIIIGVTVGSAFLLNIPTSKVIEHREAEKVKAYLVYFEGAEGLKDITEDVNPSATSGIEKVLEETSGKGYIVDVTKKGFSQDVKVIVTISSEGVILNIDVTIGAGDFAADATIASFEGQNSTLADVVMTAGATVSSTAVKDAVAAAFQILIDSGKIKAAEKSAEQKLEEAIPGVYAGFEKGAALTTTDDVYKAYKSKDGNLTVCHVKVNDQPLLAVADNQGNVKVYALNGEALSDVTSANASVVTLVTEYLAMLELESLNAVFPGATGFEEITSTLTLSSEVTNVYKEKSGKGYVIIATAQGFSKPLTVTVGISSEGLVTGMSAEVGAGDFALKDQNIESFVGQDSTLSGVVLSGGATVSTTAARTAVSSAFTALASNGLLKAAAKETEQVFEELLPTVTSGFFQDYKTVGKDKVPTYLEVSGNIYKAYTSHSKNVVVSYVTSGEDKLLAVTNISGITKVYKANLLDENTQEYELVEVTSEYADVVTEVTTFATPNFTSKFNSLSNRISTLFADAADITEVTVNSASTLMSAATFTVDGTTYYAYYGNTYSFSNEIMDVYVILDSEGKIVKVDFDTFFFEEQYFFQKPSFDKGDYTNGLVDKDSTTLGDATLVTGATLSSNGVKQALNDAFAEFLSQGGNE